MSQGQGQGQGQGQSQGQGQGQGQGTARSDVVIVSGENVRPLLPMADCIEAMDEVFRALARGDVLMPVRTVTELPDGRGSLILMPAYIAQPPALGVKVLTVMPGNAGTDHPVIQGTVLLFDPENGQLRAVVDAAPLTAIRTAAVSAVATRLLARDDAGDLAILGSGVQARSHLEAMRAVRTIRRVRVWSRSHAHAQQFAGEESRKHGITIEVCDTARAAVAGADLICTCTASPTPVVNGSWLTPGTHINAVGTHRPDTRELDTEAVARARLYVDSREAALAEAGEVLIPIKEHAVGEDHIVGEIGELLLDRVQGRRTPSDITLFKSLGLAAEDVAAARAVLNAYRPD